MTWNAYHKTKPPKAGLYVVAQLAISEVPEIAYYTKRAGFSDYDGSIDKHVTHWMDLPIMPEWNNGL